MRRLLFFLLCACALNITVSPHVLDDYVQVAQLSLSPGGVRVELRMTAGVEVADRVFTMFDSDGDGKISSAEEQAYAQRVLQDISLEVDGRRALLMVRGVQFPSRREMNEGNGVIRLDFAADSTLSAPGEHQVFFRNNHLPDIGVYLANALIPATDAIKITGQQRDTLQHELRVNFSVQSAGASESTRWIAILIVGACLIVLLSQGKRLYNLFAPAQ